MSHDLFAPTVGCALLALASRASAQGTPEPPPVRHAVGLPLTASSFDAGGGLAWRVRLPGGAQLGLDARALAVRTAYLDGYATKGGATARPGPINPATFEVESARGQAYRGSSRHRLRSDGATVGLVFAPTFDLPGTRRRVSAWENELLDGRDSSVGLGLDVGLRFSWKTVSTPWFRPYLGVHYKTVLGHDAYAKSSYGGPGLALGAQVGRW